MKRIMLLLSIASIFLSGCWDQKIYEKTGFILQGGYELSKTEGKLLVSYTSPVVGTGGKNQVEILHTTADLLREASQNAMRMSPRSLEAGKLQQSLFSEELAKKGLIQLIEITLRDPLSPVLTHIVVVEGSPAELFEKASKFKDKPRPAIYINQLLEGNIRSSYIPETRAYDFSIIYYASGIDPMTPLIRLAKDDIMVVGSALFSGDKMVGKIDHRQTSLLLAMRDMMKLTEFICTIPETSKSPQGESRHMAVMLKLKKRDIDVSIEDGRPVVNISLKFTGVLDSYKWDNMSDLSVQEKVEGHLGKEIKEDCLEVVKYLQEIGSDPIGIGDIVRAEHNNYWKKADWKDVYKDAVFNIDSEVEIMQYGVIQ